MNSVTAMPSPPAVDHAPFSRGLSPYAILSSIHTHLYSHYRTCREWFLAIDIRRLGYVRHEQIVDALENIGVHPEISRSDQLRRLLEQFPSAAPGRFDYDEFCRFISQYLRKMAPEPSIGPHPTITNDQQESAALSTIRFELLGRARNYREAFLLVDDGRHGSLSFDEFRQRLVNVGVSPSAVNSPAFERALARLPTDTPGYLQYNDFLMLLHGYQSRIPTPGS
uniref:EF-hand domain-containing protein n=1 Tax=Spongospora subterranea TaxID=70186 RepID=A0A0H5QK04_9EUKA|eukprot:CRZ02313.1 hypothetical protein [Spongospora subterranea]